jgi:taurine dioxygenase
MKIVERSKGMTNVASIERPVSALASFALAPLTGTIGAEVTGLDLTQDLSDEIIDGLSEALVAHKVLFFRDQPITTDQHLALGRRFGPLEIHPFAQMSMFANDPERPELIVLESTAEKPGAAHVWHSDVSFRPEPSMASILRCRIAPDVGGDTLWANMAAAYEGLDDKTRSLISGLTAVHDWEIFRYGFRKFGAASDDVIAELGRDHPPVEHPVVRTHPVSGEKILYVNANFTRSIKGMKEAESQSLLERLYRQASIPDYHVRFRWRADSIAFWDNRSTQHYASADFFPRHRKMERVTIAGDRPF